ncbi:unnamed protein product [Didymodactylos carnosus]|uniref:Uncharacterized protein n=1 Tax=Didymodactylos carnosus TaxID=1234261 RepID=A0A8S2G7W1_9BILA|nr:unnamed protein product [Didymodactylos carnosus]CAF4442966.1 unnamed protein product [Didymodactylos carnosus]
MKEKTFVGIIGENVNDFSLLTQVCHHLNYSVVNLNKEKSIINDFLTIVTGNPSTSSISYSEFLCYAMKQDITDY